MLVLPWVYLSTPAYLVHFFIHMYSSIFYKHTISQTYLIISIIVSYLLENSELSFLQSFHCMVDVMISYRKNTDARKHLEKSIIVDGNLSLISLPCMMDN